MKRAVICVPDPWNYISYYEKTHSVMIVNPVSTPSRFQYLLDQSDWSLLVTESGVQERNGNDYPGEQSLWYTSGTTSDSKFYSFTRSQIDYVCQQLIKEYSITANDRYVSIMGLWHAHGQMFYWLSKMVDMETTFLPISKISSLHTYHPTFITAIPDILKTLMKQPFDSLRFVRSASSALYNPLYQNLKDAFSVPVIEAFGMTEACSHCFTNPLDGEQRMGTVGLPSGLNARIEGERLFIQGPAVYTSEWVDTGDLAQVDDDGYYKILGRAIDRINVRGYKLDPLSLEQQLSKAFVEIDECVIFGKDTVKCLYVGDLDETRVFDFLKSLGQNCRPSLVEHVELIPKNPAGKVSRTMLDSIY